MPKPKLVSLSLAISSLLSFPLWAENFVNNGDFAKDAGGWMWEQWENKPVPGAVVSGPNGANAFALGGLSEGAARYFAQEVTVDPQRDLIFSFSAKLKDVAPGAARARVMVPNVGFVKGGDLFKAGGNRGWVDYKFPVTVQDLGGQSKVVVFFYHDKPNAGTFEIANVSLAPGSAEEVAAAAQPSQVALKADTSEPILSTFPLGRPVELSFTVEGVAEKATAPEVQIKITDEHGATIDTRTATAAFSGGKWVAKVQAPASKYGFYRVYAQLADGTPLHAQGSRPEGFLTYAVVVDPAKRVNHGEQKSLFGMQGGFGNWAKQSLELLGARWVLDGEFEWSKKEPAHSGQFQAANYTPSAPSGDSKWVDFPLPTLFNGPAWAVKAETFAYMTGALTPEGEKAWDAYCREAAKAYMAKRPELEQRLYQVTWEPIAPWGFKGTDEDLMRIYEIAYKALHEADPKAVVGGPTKGITREDVQQTLPLLKKGIGRYLDLITIHPYFSIEPERDGLVSCIRLLQEGVLKYSGRVIPLAGTEQGYSTEEDPEKDIIQARGLLRQNLITLGEGFRFNFAYYIVDYRLGEQKGYGYYYNLVDGVPWAPAKAGPRPIAPAYAAQTFLLDGRTTRGAIDWLGGSAWGYAFENDSDVMLALWDYGTEPKSVTIPTGVNQVTVYDWMGNERTLTTDHGNLTLPLGPEPVYVQGVAPSLWGALAGEMLTLGETTINAYPGEEIVLKGQVGRPGEALDGKLKLAADSRLGESTAAEQAISAASGEKKGYEFKLRIPPGTQPDRYPFKISLEKGDTVIALRGGLLQVASPILVAAMEQTDQPGGGLAVTLQEKQGKAASGKLEVELANVPDSRQTLDFTLEPNGSTRVAVNYPNLTLDNTKTYQCVAKVTLQNGYSFEEKGPVNFLVARKSAAPPTLQSTVGDWTSPSFAALGKGQLIRSAQEYSGPNDLAAEIRYTWDAQNLYLLAAVTDDVFQQQQTGANTWKEDCLQLAFNLDPQKAEANTGNLLADEANRHRVSELAVALTKEGPQAFRHITFDTAAQPLGQLPPEALKAQIRRDESRKVTLYALAIPWKTLGATEPPKAGDKLGIAVALNDADSADQKDPAALGLFGGIYPSKNAKKFGLLLLGGQ